MGGVELRVSVVSLSGKWLGCHGEISVVLPQSILYMPRVTYIDTRYQSIAMLLSRGDLNPFLLTNLVTSFTCLGIREQYEVVCAIVENISKHAVVVGPPSVGSSAACDFGHQV
jgi:hypothetical protein